jgi:hypothetical protein
MKALKIGGVVFVAIAIGFFTIVPTFIDQTQNKVFQHGPFVKNQWYDSIPFIADLHCDELLWKRNFLKQVDYGHVDLPRMQQSNLAFQVFTIVSKTPRGINIDSNSGVF